VLYLVYLFLALRGIIGQLGIDKINAGLFVSDFFGGEKHIFLV
jgi:hypothetical protein